MKTSAILITIVALLGFMITAFGQQPNRSRQPMTHKHTDLTPAQVRVGINNQLTEARRHHNRNDVAACNEALEFIDGRCARLSATSQRCLTRIRQDYHNMGRDYNVQTWDFVLGRCGVAPIFVSEVSGGGYTHSEHRESGGYVQGSSRTVITEMGHFQASVENGRKVDRCCYQLRRGDRAGRLCELRMDQHFKCGEFLLCPAEHCLHVIVEADGSRHECGKLACDHYLVKGNGLLCRISTATVSAVFGAVKTIDEAVMPPPGQGKPLPPVAPAPQVFTPAPPVQKGKPVPLAPVVPQPPPARKFEIPKLKPVPAPDGKKAVPVQPDPAGTESQKVQPRKVELPFPLGPNVT